VVAETNRSNKETVPPCILFVLMLVKKRKCNLTAQNEQYKDPYIMHFPFRVVDGKMHETPKMWPVSHTESVCKWLDMCHQNVGQDQNIKIANKNP
jgi:hypothetical protein